MNTDNHIHPVVHSYGQQAPITTMNGIAAAEILLAEGDTNMTPSQVIALASTLSNTQIEMAMLGAMGIITPAQALIQVDSLADYSNEPAAPPHCTYDQAANAISLIGTPDILRVLFGY